MVKSDVFFEVRSGFLDFIFTSLGFRVLHTFRYGQYFNETDAKIFHDSKLKVMTKLILTPLF
jgi:hypothetical protein